MKGGIRCEIESIAHPEADPVVLENYRQEEQLGEVKSEI